MAYRAGSAFIQVVPSLRGFQEKLKAEVAKIRPVDVKVNLDPDSARVDEERVRQERDPIKVPVKPDKLDEFSAKIKAEAAALAKSTNIDIPLTAEGERMRRDIAAQVATINRLTKIEIPTDLEDAAKLRNKMALELDVLKAMAAQARPTVTVEADTAKAEAALDRVARDRTSRIRAEAGGAGVGLLGTSIAAFGPAVIPIAGAAGGLAAALSAPLAAAGGGGTLFGLLAGLQVGNIEKTNKALAKLQTKIQADKLAVSSAASAASRKSAIKVLNADLKDYHQTLAAVTPAQKKFTNAQLALKNTYTNFSRRNSGVILGPLTEGLKLANTLLPKTAPLIHSVSTSLSGLVGELNKWARSKGADDMIGWLAAWSGRSITSLGHIIGNIATGIGSMVAAAAPMGGSVLDAIEGWSKGFRSIGRDKGFKDFLGYVRKEGPLVAHTLGDVAGAAVHILKALAPIGHVSLTAIDGLAKGIKKIPTGVLTVAGGALAGILVSLKGISAAKGTLGFLSKIPKLGGLLGRLGGGEVAGELGGKLGKGVVPVYVTNKGFGGPGGGPGGVPNDEKKVSGKLGRLLGGAGLWASILPELGTLAAPAGVSAFVLTHPKPALHPSKHATKVLNAAGARPSFQMPLGTQWHIPSKADVKNREGVARATREQVKAQAGLNKLLLSPAMPEYAKQLKSLPTEVQTKVQTPGAVQSGKDIAKLTRQYKLTPKQVRTLVNLLGQEGALRKAIKLGRQYNLTPKQVKTIIAQAGMDSSQKEINRLAYLYRLTPKQVRTLIRADASQAFSAIGAAQRMINSLHGKTVTIRTVRETSYYSKRAGIPGPGSADGSTVPKGGAYRDRYPYLLAPGEEVISNRYGQADRWRPVLKAINAGRLADGGSVGAMTAGLPSRVVMQVDDMEFTAYVSAVADDRVAAASNLDGMRAGAGAR